MSPGISSAIGARLRLLRHARGKSLAVVAGRAGISPSYLSRLEAGERALDRRSLIVALADALEVAPSELTGVPLGLAGEPGADQALVEVRMAMLAVAMGEPDGEVQPVERLRARVGALLTAVNDARGDVTGARLPSLIRDLHTTLAAGRHEREILRLLALAHMQGTEAWLAMAGAPNDLTWQAATLARSAAEALDEPVPLGIAAYGSALALLSAGALDLAARTLHTVALPTATVDELQLAGSLSLVSSLVSAARRDTAARTAALAHAAELAGRTGETNVMGFGFGPSNVGVWRMQCALEAGEHAEAAKIATEIDPEALTVRARRAVYWRDRARSVARLPRQRDAAVVMLRRAERLSPDHVRRHPFTVSLLEELVAKAKRDAVGRELRGLAFRAGLPV
ncbi:helix-turn-helix transcriptional regulator [Amycolatopsis cynarae]|uniref:Helix-turn-helix transcriptional regulator n=1 Tax=Amycolatopsis cynarae TaxID=2995223 RepID=A0ABY7B9Q8_9PSEU|nr:helix-turn-helix transcriptional regulator [Amycolatopsis sp. HUAS 11-8]WAL68886.1 helix-turn-helix transcriptional regulator [Amycolatopsis sp. HUAS 11-8]